MANLKLSSGVVLTDADRTAMNTWLATGQVPGAPPPPIQPPPATPPTTWNDNQRLWIAAATGHPDMGLFNSMGQAAYTNAVQARSTGGPMYQPAVFSQASMAGGSNTPPFFTWAAKQAAGEGSNVNGTWVWAPKMYPLFLALR